MIDRDSPFLELSSVAAAGTEYHVGGSGVGGIGVVSGVECVITGNDPTVRGGAVNPYSLAKSMRALTIARQNRLPVIFLAESGGADLPRQAEIFVPGGAVFRDLTQLSAMGIPTIALVFGNSTAGGAYNPAMCDYSVFVRGRAKVFLGGPPLVKMATGEESTDEELGGAEMHARVSGLSDYLANDEFDCPAAGPANRGQLELAKARARRPARQVAEPLYDAEDLLGLAPADLKVPADIYEVLARVVDGSRFDEYKPLYGTSLVTGWASIHGFPVGILANARGVLFSEEAQKATQFIQLANRNDVPLVFIQNVTGYMVGKEYEQRGIIKHGAMMINAVSNSTVPHVTLQIGASYGAGNYGMCGRAYNPRFVFIWPNSKTAVMGPQQLAGVMSIVSRARRGRGRPPLRRSRPTRCSGPSSRIRSKASRWPPTPAPASTTTASSTRATRAPCWASRCRRATRTKFEERGSGAFFACNDEQDPDCKSWRNRPPCHANLPRDGDRDRGRLFRAGPRCAVRPAKRTRRCRWPVRRAPRRI